MQPVKIAKRKLDFIAFFALLIISVNGYSQQTNKPTADYFTIENYYKVEPIFHSGEDTRWDFRVTIVFKNVKTGFDANLTEPYKKQLYPDAEALKKAEQHRFELLLAHWDIETENDSLN